MAEVKKQIRDQYPGKVDKYPRTDVYIPDAKRMANKIAVQGSQEWSLAFLRAMNTLLSKAGLRVL